MPYCCQCGTAVGQSDRYCIKCGSAQAAVGAGRPGVDHRPDAGGSQTGYTAGDRGFRNSNGFCNKHAALLCYIPWFGWIAAIIVLASGRYRRDYEVRFHAFQGLYLFVAWLLVDWVVSPALRMTGYGFWQPLPRGGGVLHLLILAGWIVMIVKVGQGQHYRLPILGDLAERSVAEQRAG
jgi:uncharacterized membrane protein